MLVNDLILNACVMCNDRNVYLWSVQVWEKKSDKIIDTVTLIEGCYNLTGKCLCNNQKCVTVSV
jgi:hypothetical protein